MSLLNFLLNAVGSSRSFRDWREVRPTRLEIVLMAAFIVLIGFVVYLALWSGVENHCLWDKLGSKCLNGG